MVVSGKSLAEMWSGGHKSHTKDAKRRIEVAKRCLRLLPHPVSLESVVDFGCGIGAWLHAAQELGAKQILGLEGDYIKNTPVVIPRDTIRIADLAQEKFDFQKSHSLAMTIEVAEHLPEEAADGFIESLVNASDYVLFSAAIPRQGGIGHINEQPLMYWLKKFWQFGYVPLDPIRPYIARDSYIYGWIRQNIVMFVNYDLVLRSPELLRHARPLPDFYLHYQPRDDIKTF